MLMSDVGIRWPNGTAVLSADQADDTLCSATAGRAQAKRLVAAIWAVPRLYGFPINHCALRVLSSLSLCSAHAG